MIVNGELIKWVALFKNYTLRFILQGNIFVSSNFSASANCLFFFSGRDKKFMWGGIKIKKAKPNELRHINNYIYQACSISCISQAIFTSSLTTTPPASVTALQVKPKSLRFILPLMVKPALVLP